MCQILILRNALKISPEYCIKQESSLILCFKHGDFYLSILRRVVTEVKWIVKGYSTNQQVGPNYLALNSTFFQRQFSGVCYISTRRSVRCIRTNGRFILIHSYLKEWPNPISSPLPKTNQSFFLAKRQQN